MYELAWIALGVAVALVALRLWCLGKQGSLADAQLHQPKTAAELEAAHETAQPAASIETIISPESREMALSMAGELASLVSAVEGRAHHLIEAAPTRTKLPSAAEDILISIARLRGLHTKLVAFGGARPTSTGTTDLTELISGLGEDLQQMQLGLELRFDPPADPPLVRACPAAMRDAMLFVCGALLKAERGATRLTFSVERSFASENPEIIVELNLEWISSADSRKRESLVEAEFALELEAGRQLVRSHGGELSVSHLPGKSVQAVVELPMAVPAELTEEAAEEVEIAEPETSDANRHSFGGALVLESDPTLRAVLSRELKASGRAVFACADGASAHTFLMATPDRFELLIVDDPHQLDEHTPLARTIRQHTPDLKICLMTPSVATPPEAWPGLHCLQKPFGVHELRRKLASILTVG